MQKFSIAGVEPVTGLPERPAWLDEVCRFLAATRFEDLPDVVVARTRQVLYDDIGAIAAGAQEPEVGALARRLGDGYGGGLAPAIGLHGRLPWLAAALVNGTAGTMLELDEGNQYCRGHPGIHVVPAALAAAGVARASGRDLLLGIALGYEIGARIGIASKLNVAMHPHGTWGTVGAAVTTAKIAGADAATFRETINVASSLGLTTSRRTMLEGGTVRNTYAGFSNQLGLTVFEMVRAGLTGEVDGLSTVYGKVAASDFRPAEMTAELGTRWEIARNYFKRHACCRYNHATLDALGRIVAEAGGRIAPDDVVRVTVDTYIWAAQLAWEAPPNMLAAKFSIPFSVATFIANGAATLDAYRETARADAATQALARRVVVREDAALTAELPALRPSRVAVHLKDGRVLRAESLTNKGDTEDPYPESEIRAKFLELASPVFGAGDAQAILSAVDRLDTAGDLAALLEMLGR